MDIEYAVEKRSKNDRKAEKSKNFVIFHRKSPLVLLKVIDELLHKGTCIVLHNQFFLMTWNSTLKWCIQYTDNTDANIEDLKKYILNDWNRGNLYSCCALHVAVAGKNTDAVKCLIDYGFSVDSRKTNGTTPIHWACQKGNLSMVALLLSYNANPHATDYGKNIFKI